MSNYPLHITHHTLPILALLTSFFFAACGDFMEPVESTPEPTAYEFNYWLLKQTYLYEEDLDSLPVKGDSIQDLYKNLSDPYTRYYPPSKSEAAETHMNTSIVEGDLGMEYLVIYVEDSTGETIGNYPILISRVYAESPAGRAGVPRYGRIIAANNIGLWGQGAKALYDSIVDYSATVSLVIFYNDSLYHFDLTKESVYAPTVFVDTISGITFVSITEFKGSTVNRTQGTFGELKAYLDSTSTVKEPRVLDLRYNPGGLISQCMPVADLFIKEGLLSERKLVSLSPDGKRTHESSSDFAKAGDPGEGGKFVMLTNRGSASCTEIFIAALKEQGNIPAIGETTFGKGIGQSQWKTMEGGLAVITNLEFFTPKGNSYHKIGIVPDIECSGATRNCAIEALETLYGQKTSSASTGTEKLAVEKALLLDNSATRNVKTGVSHGGAVDPEIHFLNYSHSL